jgi:hypothetical protein
MSEREIVKKLLNDLSIEEKYLSDAVGYVLIKLFPTQDRIKFSKRHILRIIKEYLKTNKR